MRAEPPLANKEGFALSQARLARRFAAACFGKPVHFSFLLAEKRFDFLLPALTHTAFLEGARGKRYIAHSSSRTSGLFRPARRRQRRSQLPR